MTDFGCLFTVRGRTTTTNGVPAFDKKSHIPNYDNIVPDELVYRILASTTAQEAVASILEGWEKAKGDLKAFTSFLNEMKVVTNIIGAFKAWGDESKMSFLEFLLQPAYHHHFSALLGKEGMIALNKEIDLRGYLHEVGVLCRLIKAHRIGSQHQGSDVDLMCMVNQVGDELDPEDMTELQTLYGTEQNLDPTLYTLSPDSQTVAKTSKGRPLVVHFLLSCNGIMSQLSPEQMQELLQIRIRGFWGLFTKWDLIPFLVHSGKSDEEAKAILARTQEGTLGAEDMDALVEAFRNGRITIPIEQRILDKWIKALNSHLKQYIHIMALINGHYTAKKEDLVAQSGITGNALSFLKYVLYHGNQEAMTQEGVTDLLHQMLNDASLFTSIMNLKQGPMWKTRIEAYAQRLADSKNVTSEQGQEQPPVPLTADILKLLTNNPNHPVVQWFLVQIREVKRKRDMKEKLTPFETSLMGIVTKLTSETTDDMLVSMLGNLPPKDLSKIVPKDAYVLKSIPSLSRGDVEQMSGMLMTLNGVTAQCIPYGDGVSLDKDRCIVIIINDSTAEIYIVKTPSGIHAPRDLSSTITNGEDVSILMLMEKDGKLVPVEIRNFYLDKEEVQVQVKEDKGKLVHLDGSSMPPTAVLDYELVPATSPQLCERYAILYTTGDMPEEFRIRLSTDPLVYTSVINHGKWRDLVHYIIRWVSESLVDISVLLHMLNSIKAPQSLITRIEAFKLLRNELFEAMKKPNAVNKDFMQKWVSMLHEVFALGLHTPDVLSFIHKNGSIEGLTPEQTQKIQRYVKTMCMNRLSFFKAVVFRLCQITYGLFVCIPENQRMIYVKAELAEKVLPVLHKKKIQMSIDTLVALLHRNFSLPNDIRLTSSLHMDFEKFVLGALAVLFPHFTGQELCQGATGEPVSWLLVTPIPDAIQEPLPALVPEHLVASASIPIQEAPTLEELQQFVKDAKNRSAGKPWSVTIALFKEWCKEKHLEAMLIEVAKNDNILIAIADVAKRVCDKSQPQRIEALIVLALTNYFGHGQKAFIESIKADKGVYNPTDDIKALHGRIAKLHTSVQTPVPAPVPVLAHVSLWNKYKREVHDIIKNFRRGLLIIAVFDDNGKVIIIVQNEDVFHVSPLPEGTLCFMSYTHPALSWEILSSMTHRLTTQDFQILGTDIPASSPVPLVLTKKQVSCQELYRESIVHLTSQGISVLYGIRFGSSLQHAEETRPMDRDVDFRIIITEGERKGIEFTASDGTKCDLSFTNLDNAKQQHEVLIAMLLGSSWLDASGNKVELFTLPSTLKECLQMLLPLVGTTIHHNSVKGKDDPIKTFQSVRLMVVLMQMVIEHQKYPHYNPLTFFPKGFNKDAFVEFLCTSEVKCAIIVDLFTKVQYIINKSALKAQETKYQSIIEALPEPLKELMLKFKMITTTSFPNLSDKKGVSGVRTVLEYISKQ
jgi:hypothetical protein